MNSRSYKALMIVCAILEKRKEREKSIAYYNDLLSLHPDNEEQIRCYLAFALQETGKESQAMEIMNDMIGKHPMEATLYVNRAFLSAETGKLDAGLADLEKAAILSNDDYNVFLKRRELFTYMNRTADAENELKKALAVLGKKLNENPDDLDLLFIRADLLLKKGDLNEALADYSSILKYLPENYKALKNIARIESANANWGNALNCYETLYKCYDPETEFYTNLAVIHARLNQNEKALHFFNEGARFDPDDTDLLYKRSIFYMTVNDRTAGCKELAKLSRLLEEKKGKGALNREEDELRKRIQADRDKCCGER
jgi:Flp pilus assembly protein TadD